MAQIASPLSSSDEQATAATDLVVRTIVSIAVCIVLSWQLTETVSSSRAAAKENISNDDAKGNSCCCCFSGNTTLQWFLLILMLFSVLEGLVGLFADLFLIGLVGDAVPVANVRAEISMSIALGRIGDAIISLMIMGLGVSSWSRHSAKVAVALGFASLVTRLLPAPLVLQGTTPSLAPRSASCALEAHTRRLPELLSARFVLPAHIRLCWVPIHLQHASAAVEALTHIKARLHAAYAP
jgi:hypothetical protein